MDELSETSSSDDIVVKSASRALQLLELLTGHASPLSFSDIQQRLRYPKASLHGLLRTMTGARWLNFDPVAKQFTLGVRVWEAGLAYAATVPLEARARPFMMRLRDQTTETVHLAVLDDGDVLYVGRVDGEHLLRLESSVGRRMEPHASGVGKILLAELAEVSLRAWLANHPLKRFTDTTITEPQKLLVELQLIRERGYAVDREERTLGAACVAVGVRDHTDTLVAAMSVSAPAVRFGEAQREAALVHLRAAAEDLSQALGRTPPSLQPGERGVSSTMQRSHHRKRAAKAA